MKKSIRNTLTILALMTGLLGLNLAHANETAIKLLLKTQNFSVHQQELAFRTITSIKVLAEEVKHNKENVQAYLTSSLDKDEMDVEYMMSAYRQWQTNMDMKLENTLHTIAALHGELTLEQRRDLFQKLQNLSR